jgi:hypothetical protein
MNTIQFITIQGKDISIQGITKGSNAIVTSTLNGKFLISKTNFNKLINVPNHSCTGVLANVEGYALPLFKTLKF